MQQQDLIALLTQLKGSLSTGVGINDTEDLQKNLAPILAGNLQNDIVNPTAAPVIPPDTSAAMSQLYKQVSQNRQILLPGGNHLLQQSPVVLTALKSGAAPEAITPAKEIEKGAGILNSINLQSISASLKQWYTGLHFTEFISVYLASDTVNPVLMLPVTVSLFESFKPLVTATEEKAETLLSKAEGIAGALHITKTPPVSKIPPITTLPQGTSYTIAKGSAWIASKLLCSGVPAGSFTGLTITGGTLTFNQKVTINSSKAIIMPAGCICSVQLNLDQPVDTTVSPDNIGIDAMNAQVKLPTSISFNFSTTAATITAIADGSWNLYGSANTFKYATGQPASYSPTLNSILIGFDVTAPTFAVTKCDSPLFTIEGTAPILLGFWELPVATIDITTTNTATGIGALAVVCSAGLKVNWSGLSGGQVSLRLPMLSATTGIIGILDAYAGNVYGSQHYNLWSNETTGLPSTLDLNYSDLFTLYYLSMQDGAELLSTDADFNAQIDRPLRVDGSPIDVKGKKALLFQYWTPAEKIFFLYDTNLIADNYTPAGGGAVTRVPQEAIALTNALLTVTPPAGIILYGLLSDPETIKKARLIITFGLYYLIPALRDPYASTFELPFARRIVDGGLSDARELDYVPDGQASYLTPRTLPLTEVKQLLLGIVRWPVTTPEKPDATVVSFAILPLPGNDGITAQKSFASTESAPAPTATPPPPPPVAPPAGVTAMAQQVDPDPGQRWDKTVGPFGAFDLAMLDVSTNADLMGVSFSPLNIRTESEDKGSTIIPVNNGYADDLLQIVGMDLSTRGQYVRAFTVPEITWEPTINLTVPAAKSGAPDPPFGWLLFANDGGPTQIFNNSPSLVSIDPTKVSDFIIDQSNAPTADLVTASLFTLPFGMRSMAFLFKDSADPNGYVPASLNITPPDFDFTPEIIDPLKKKIITGGLQIIAKGQQDPTVKSSPSFKGFTLQLRNLLDASGSPVPSSILGPSVDTIFNGQFEPPTIHDHGVPVERIDFSGYGASMFSNWLDPTATIAATSQAKFDVFVGRTSLEIIQVKSLIYPWGIKVVRTITMYRAGSAMIYRVDSGWRAETDGVYDFSYKDSTGLQIDNPYVFHPGVVKGVFSVKNIIENDLPQFNAQLTHKPGDKYIDDDGKQQTVPPGGIPPETVTLQPVYFDADVQIDNVVQGATNGKVPSKKMVGYVQLAPRGEPISPALFFELLATQSGALGGPVDCIVDIGQSGQKMRVTHVDVSNSLDQSGANPVFSGTARGTVILPKDGSWSIVQHSQKTDSVSNIDNNAPVPLIRRGALKPDGSSDYPAEQIRLANPIDLLKDPDDSTINFGLLQNTGTQKTFFQLPAYVQGVKNLLSKGNNFPLAKFADAYHLLNSTSIFPDLGDIPDMDMSKFSMNVLDQGYKLLNNINPGDILKQFLPSPFYFVNTKDVKLYIEYNAKDDKNQDTPNLNYDLDSTAEKWISSAKNITLNVDLGPFTKMVYINGNFDSSNNSDTAFNIPLLQFGPDLKPIVDILQILADLSGGDYTAIAEKALSIAMGNSGDNFEYKFHADKEIATIKFPPPELDGPTTPLRLTAGLKVGAYFNEALSLTSDPSNLIPSAGAYFEFDGGMQIMCVSVGVGTIYAVGQVVVKLSADLKTGPSLYMKFGFGVELMVGLPVVGDVSVTFMVGVEMTLSTSEIKITAFLLFKGEADLLGGLVDITITIEASGTIDRKLVGTPSTDMTAQVTFAIDISIFLVINIDFSKSWSETKQIA